MPAAKVATETPSNWPLRFVTLPLSCSCMRPVVNISECTPKSPRSPSASSPTSVDGTDPIPVWSVAPSGMKARAWSAIARSASVGGGSWSGNGAASLSTSTSISSTWRACGWSGGRPNVAGNRSDTSTTSRRSGSWPALRSSPIVPPAWSDRLHQPSPDGGAAIVAITRGRCSSKSGANRRKSAGAKLMFAPPSRSARSIGPKKPER